MRPKLFMSLGGILLVATLTTKSNVWGMAFKQLIILPNAQGVIKMRTSIMMMMMERQGYDSSIHEDIPRILPSSSSSDFAMLRKYPSLPPSTTTTTAATTMTCTGSTTSTSRRNLSRWMASVALAVLLVVSPVVPGNPVAITPSLLPLARAAPPIAIIAEELGYYPVTNRLGETVYVPQTVKRSPSTRQAIQLAQELTDRGVIMAGTYWCPHTIRQRELFGREAWNYINYRECSPKGYNSAASYCLSQKVDGYPTWIFADGTQLSGERPLEVLAQTLRQQPKQQKQSALAFSTIPDFRPELETNLPPLVGAGVCTLPK